MTISSQRLTVFITDSHPCSYLDDRVARTAFIDPDVEIDQQMASLLNLKGFRRSGRYLYKSSCPNCTACQPLRVEVDQFQPSRSQKRNIKRNADLSVCIKTPSELDLQSRQRYYVLYQRYICTRHPEGDMYPPNPDQFDNFIGQLFEFSRIIEFRLNDNLVMATLCDQLTDGYSAIYTFFDPALHSRGLGTYAILWQIYQCQKQQLPYLYLGFWIEMSKKMNYKSSYKPHQIFHTDKWQSSAN